jgi:hypothetical protein
VKQRMIPALAVAIVLAGTIGLAQAPGRVEQYRYTWGSQGDVIASCADYGLGDFQVLEDWEVVIRDMYQYDKDGQPTQWVENLRATSDRFYNSVTGKSLDAGPGETQEMRVLFENGRMVSHRWSGVLFKINVPGHGLIFAESGRATWVWDPNDPANLEHSLVANSGHNMWVDRDLEVLCEYLQ